MKFPILTIVAGLPAFIALILLPIKNERLFKVVSLIGSLLTFTVSLPLYFAFQTNSEFQFTELCNWIPAIGASYNLGIDGISLFMVLLTTFLTPIIILSSWNSVKKSMKGFLIAMLMLETGILGAFMALDLLLFYMFWEVMLIPMYFLIGIWGGERRIYAAIKFVLYTVVGSLLMLVAILFIYYYHGGLTGDYTFNLLKIQQIHIPLGYQTWLFLAFGLSFAIKAPIFPFHTWLPDAHVEAPTGGSVILAGVLLKMGTYGFLRFCLPLFPHAVEKFTPLLLTLGVIGIIYGALVAMVQPDMKKLVAYSSVSHLGFVIIGVFSMNAQGVAGGVIQMVNHGLSTGALFLLVGMIYERRHTRLISEFGGLAKQLPIFTVFFMIATLSSIGLPGLNGFVGEYLILLGAFLHDKTYAIFATSGVILAAVYMLYMFQRVMFGKLENEKNKKLADLSAREICLMVPILALIILIGVYPGFILRKIEPSVNHLIHSVKTKQALEQKIDEPLALDTTHP